MGKRDGPLVAEMYEELKKEIDDYNMAHPGVPMSKAPRLIPPFMTPELLHIKEEDVETAREDFRFKIRMGQISPPTEAD